MKTIVILGMAHCGTTMLAQIVDALGVPMVLGGDRGHCEDADVARALSKQSWFETLVAERSGRPWGWKHPGGWRFAHYYGCLENPTYLAIYKDPVTVARRFEHNMPYVQDDHRVQATTAQMLRSINGILSTGLPVHYLSYLDAVRCPYLFVEQVVEACELGVSQREMYAASETIKLQGVGYG